MKTLARPLAWSEQVRRRDGPERRRFVGAHLDLVRYLALRIASRLPSSVEVEDLIHDGIVGLLDAVEKFDPARNVRFRTYAEARVRGAILDGLRRKDWAPRSVRRGQRELDAAIDEVASKQGRAATEDEIASALNLDVETYRSMLQIVSGGSLVPLEELPERAEPSVGEAHLPHHHLERRELIDALSEEIVRLPDRERRVVEFYYHEGLNMKEIGAALGVTESRVCQIHSQAAARLRVALGARLHAAPALAGAAAWSSARKRQR
jgi:RNA polymerase sigma factor for flagellar operon FliA